MINAYRIGDVVEWTDDNNVKHTGTVIEWAYDPVTIRTQYLIKLPNGQYIAKWDCDIRRVDDT